MKAKKRTTKIEPKPKLIQLIVIDSKGRHSSPLNIDMKLLRAQSKTLGNILDSSHGFVNVYEFADAEIESVQGVWEMMHSILDKLENQ